MCTFLLAACAGENAADVKETASAPSSLDEARAAPVVVELRMRSSEDAPYVSVSSVDVPDTHEIHDGMFPYEGMGWENGFVGYRMYFDERGVIDIFGKQTPDPTLANIGLLGSYHELADWGMDVLKVGTSLGLGGIGVMRNDEPQQFGPYSAMRAEIIETGGDRGVFELSVDGVTYNDASYDIDARFSIENDSPVTSVELTGSPGLPLATGVVMHEGAELIQSANSPSDEWSYVGTYGAQQSENKDGLGMAVFYKTSEGAYGGLANGTHYVAFSGSSATYKFVAAWEKDATGVKSAAAFRDMLEGVRAELNAGDVEE
jgi:hypothetical protein